MLLIVPALREDFVVHCFFAPAVELALFPSYKLHKTCWQLRCCEIDVKCCWHAPSEGDDLQVSHRTLAMKLSGWVTLACWTLGG